MRAYPVDDLLARLDGEVAPIWVSIGLRVEDPGPIERWVDALRALVDATPRLNMRWGGAGWVHARRDAADVRDAVRVAAAAPSLERAVARLAGQPARLESDLPLRLTWTPLDDGTWALTLQLHHAVGDARALGRATRRLWRAFTHGEATPDHTPPVPVSRARLLAALATRPLQSLGHLDPARFLLSRRATPMRRDGDEAGAPTLRAVTLQAGEGVDPVDLFHGALLATTAAFIDAPDGTIRWRTPFDLSAPLGLHGAFCNTCVALPLEFDLGAARQGHPRALAATWRRAARQAWSRGAPWAALLECAVAARVASTDALRHGARPGLTADPRTNTAVVTFVGDLTRYLDGAPFEVLDACGQTPTWGANAWTMRGRLVVNFTCFEGIWRDATLDAFAHAFTDVVESSGLGARITREGALHA